MTYRTEVRNASLVILLITILVMASALITAFILLPMMKAYHSANTFVYSFNAPGVLDESEGADRSPSPYWFLDSGGELIITDGVGKTVQGALLPQSRWRLAYAASNPLDTDNGYRPQNIFRLLTKSLWENALMEASFMITKDNLSSSPNRNASNGLLLMSRYQDSDNLYYAGIRVDGTAIIKKKYHGTYYTLAQKRIFPGIYGPHAPNLLPHDTWIGLRSVTETNASGSVSVTLYMKQTDTSWVSVVSATDNGTFGKTPPITLAGADGIRTDYMDVVFANVRISSL